MCQNLQTAASIHLCRFIQRRGNPPKKLDNHKNEERIYRKHRRNQERIVTVQPSKTFKQHKPWNDNNRIRKHQGRNQDGKQDFLHRKIKSRKPICRYRTGNHRKKHHRKYQFKCIEEKIRICNRSRSSALPAIHIIFRMPYLGKQTGRSKDFIGILKRSKNHKHHRIDQHNSHGNQDQMPYQGRFQCFAHHLCR